MLNKKFLYFALVTIGVTTLGVVYYLYNPSKYSFFPKCPFHTLTGFDCPGCGSQRAFYFLLHGRVLQAARQNVLFVASVPFLFIHFYYKAKTAITKQDYRWKVIYHPLTPKIIFALVVVFWVVRNIPVSPFNYLSEGL
jgi:hypothetical protein